MFPLPGWITPSADTVTPSPANIFNLPNNILRNSNFCSFDLFSIV